MLSNFEEKVSVIIPAYNAERFIEETIESLIKQDYTSWEAIIVDDCSTDATLKIIEKYQKNDGRFKVYKNNTNLGAAITRNKAIEKATGRYLAFLDSDDLWTPDKLSKQLSFMVENNYPFTCTSYGKIDEQSNKLKQTVKSKHKIKYNRIFTNVPGNLTVIYDTKYIPKTYIPDIKKRNDLLMWARVIKKTDYLYGLNNLLGYHRIRSGSISSNKKELIRYNWKVYYKFEKLTFFKSSFILTIVVMKSILSIVSRKMNK